MFFIGFGLSGVASLLFAFLGDLRDLRGESKFFLTAEHAQDAEGKKSNAFVVSGAASLLFVFLGALRELCGEIN